MPSVRFLFKAFLILGIITVAGGCGVKPNASKENIYFEELSTEVQNAYNNDQSVLLFSFHKNTQNSEAYADWAEYLNNFSSNPNSDFHLFKISKEDKNYLSIPENNFTVFLKKEHPTYFYSGLIVEPQVYTAVKKQYSKENLSEMDRSFLPQPLCSLNSQSLRMKSHCSNGQ